MKRGTNIDRLHVAIQVSNRLAPPNCMDYGFISQNNSHEKNK